VLLGQSCNQSMTYHDKSYQCLDPRARGGRGGGGGTGVADVKSGIMGKLYCTLRQG
jgi:hypothetical protein